MEFGLILEHSTAAEESSLLHENSIWEKNMMDAIDKAFFPIVFLSH
jgi:hypothetical protein